MNLSKTALRELSAKYRAVLIKCALMNMMIFAGALMPHTAEAYTPENRTITVANDYSTLSAPIFGIDKIVFARNATFDGKENFIVQNWEPSMVIEGDGTLKNIILSSPNGFQGNGNTLSIAGSAAESVKFNGEKLISNINFNLLDGSSLTFGGVTLSGGTLSITGNAAFRGALENSTITITGDYIWSKDRMRLDYAKSSGNTLELGSSENPVTLTMGEDIAIDTIIQPDKTFKAPQSVTILGNGNTLSVKKLTAAYTNNFNFDNVKIKSDTLSVEYPINLKNNTSVTILQDLTLAKYETRIIGDGTTAIHFENNEATISSGKFQNVFLFAKNKLTTDSVFIGTTITAKAVDISSSSFFKGDNTIVADEISAKNTFSVNSQASLTLKKKDGTRGVLKMDNAWHLYGKFTGDVIGGKITIQKSGAEFYGKMNVAELEVYKSAFRVSPLKGSHVGTLNLNTSYDASEGASIRIDSDFSAETLNFKNTIEKISSSALEKIAGKISGNGTLKINNASVQIVSAEQISPDKTAYFDGIKIAALNKDLTFNGDREAKYDFTNNAISASGAITFHKAATFHGASFLTARSITANEGISLDGTLTVNVTLDAHKITGGTLNIVLPETAGASPIIKADAENVTLTLDLKNVKSKNAQEYRLTNSKDGYTVSGDYGKYAFSADGNFANYRTDKDAFNFANAWKNSDGALWIMRISGGAESAIDDLRMAGIYVSPTEENASKILDLTGNNPFADRLTDLLDSGDAGLQKQALREIVPTDAAASAFKSAKSTANAVMNSVSGRLGGDGSDISGRSGGDLTVGKSVAWVQGLFNRAKMTGGDGFTSGTTGFAAGVEHNVTDEIKAGFGYAFASTDIKTGRSKTDADTHTGFVYGEYAPDALYVNAMLSFGRSDYNDTTRAAGMKSSYRADTYGARVAAGYALGLLTPEAALRFTAVRQKAYTDALGARVAAKNLNTATAVIGTKASKTFTAGKHAITPEVKLALTYDFARPKEDRTVTLPDGSSYVAAGEHLKRLGMEIGAKAARSSDQRSGLVGILRRRVQKGLSGSHRHAEP